MLLTLVSCDRGEAKTEKPVIYLYPKTTEKVSVKLSYKGKITCTYPDYKNGWKVTANPDGKLVNADDNKEYSYLFWEGNPSKKKWDMSKGFVVAGKDTKKFLQEKLMQLGLVPKEYNEFIVYWLPRMQGNKYNLITFQTTAYSDTAKLQITPKPQSILRVYMVYKPLSRPVKIGAPKIQHFERKGFTVVEWGGTELK